MRLIIPFPPGGSNDIVGRVIESQLGERLGKQVVATVLILVVMAAPTVRKRREAITG